MKKVYLPKLLCLPLIFAQVFFSSQASWGQSRADGPSTTPKEVMPPAPDAAALGRYGDTPVSLYKGTPDISIPLYTFQVPGFKLPIHLTYNASGIKVDEVASSVGLGWALNAGGVITSVVNGKSDLVGNQPRVMPADIRNFNPSYETSPADYEFARRVIDQQSDTQPDIFYYNFAGRTGKFMFSADRTQIALIPYQPLLFRYTNNGAAGDYFTVTDEQGIRYEFKERERSTVTQECDRFVNGKERVLSQNSAWYLSKITTPLGVEVTLSYSAVQYSYKQSTSETLYYLPRGSGSCPDLSERNAKCTATHSISGKRLSSISSTAAATRLEFVYSSAKREDLNQSATTGNSALESIQVKYGTRLAQEQRLSYTYLRSPGFTSTMTLEEKALYSRLCLTAVQRMGMPAHQFTYNTMYNLPQRLSFGQDFWGYFNGSTSNATLIQRSTTYDLSKGANRAPSLGYIQANMLTEITYPTGGKTIFTYESNHHFTKKRIDSFKPGRFSLFIAEEDRSPGKTEELIVPEGSQAYDGLLSWYLPYVAGESKSTGSITEPGRQKRFFPTGSGSERRTLLPGTYTFSIIDLQRSGAAISYSWKTPLVTYEYGDVVDPGIRIAKITDIAAGRVAKTRIYRYPADTKETGREGNYGVSYPTDNVGGEYKVPKQDANGQVAYCTYRVFSSSSPPSIGEGSSGPTFPTVWEYTDSEGKHGRTTYTFTSSYRDFPNLRNGEGEVFDSWARGLPLTTTVERFDSQQQNYVPVQRLSNTYYAHHRPGAFWIGDATEAPNHERFIPGYGISYLHPEYVQTLGGTDPTIPAGFIVTRAQFIVNTYAYPSVWYYLKSKQETRYNAADATQATTTTTHFRYQNPAHAQLTQQLQTRSDGVRVSTKFRYPLDYSTSAATSAPAQAIQLLTQNHLLTPVLEQQEWIQAPTRAPAVVGGVLTHYEGLLPKKVWMMRPVDQVDSARFTSSQIQAGHLVQDELYQAAVEFDQYDTRGNLLQQHRFADVPTSYVWGYQQTLPLASIQNATSSQVEAALGALGTDRATLNVITDEQQLRGVFTKLRQRLPQARLTSMTHQPLVGISSQTAADGRTVFYEYDALGRLVRTRDEQNRILSQQEYHYADK